MFSAIMVVVIAALLPFEPLPQEKITSNPEKAVQRIALPKPSLTGRTSLEELMAKRRSVREYSTKMLGDQELGQLLWAAQGITSPDGRRTAPSAGAKYPLELYVATSTGFFHYLPKDHALERIVETDLRPALATAALGQQSIATAPVVFVFTAEYARTAQKYGDRTPRYVAIEVGHAAQNLLLQAGALGLVGVPVGAFRDDEVSKALSLPAQFAPLYLVAVGSPR